MTRDLLASHGGPSAPGAARLAPLIAARLGAELDALGVAPPIEVIDYGYGLARRARRAASSTADTNWPRDCTRDCT